MGENIKNIAELEKRLTAVEKKENKLNALSGILDLAVYLCALILMLAIFEFAFNFNPAVRKYLFVVFNTGALFFYIYFVHLSFFRKRNKHTREEHLITAQKIGDHFTGLKDELKNVLQIIYDNFASYSEGLAGAALTRLNGKCDGIDFTKAIDSRPVIKKAKRAFIIVPLTMILIVAIPSVQQALYRILNYSKDFSPPPKYTFTITPGNAEITKGSDVEISINLNDKNVNEIDVYTKALDESEYKGTKTNKSLSGGFIYKMVNVQNSFAYYAYLEGIKSSEFDITVINRPIITRFELKIIPPSYSGMPEELQSDNGNLTALAGSNIYYTLTSSKELKKAFIVLNDSTKAELKINVKKAAGSIIAGKDISYHFNLVDESGNENSNPAEYSIKVLPDAYPVIEMLAPDKNYEIGRIKIISLVSRIKDDYGFSKMILNYRLSASKYEKPKDEYTLETVNIKKNVKEEDVYHNFDIGRLYLSEGDVLSCYLEIFDNDSINGPKSAKGEIFTLRFPSVDNLFDAVAKEEDNIEKEMKDLLEQSDKLKDELKKASNELKKDKKELSWEEKNKIENNLENYKNIEKKIEDVKNQVSNLQKDMAKNDMLSPETMQKYMELQNLFNELNSEELKLAVQRLQEALKSMMRDKTQQALENFKLDEEELKNSIERTLNLLKKIKVEQKIDELLKRTQNLEEKASDLEKKVKEDNLNDKEKNEELQNRQKDITDDLKNLNEEMKEADGLMKKLDDMPVKEMEKLIEEFKKQNNEEISEKSELAIKQGQKENALRNEQAMLKNISSLEKLISQMKKSFLEKNQMKTFKEMMKVLDNLLTLSKNQEKLRIETDKLNLNSNQFGEKLRAQNDLKSGLLKVIENITALSQKSFSITPEMGKVLGKAVAEMQNSITILQNKGNYSSQNQRSAMNGLNHAASLLKGAMDKMMSGGQGGGMMSLMQQLQQLSGDQMSLNQLTDQMNKGGLSMQEQGQMQRLAQQQELIRKSLEQLNREAKEAGQSKSLAGSLDKALSEMQEVVKELKGEKLNNELVKQQERILSRMLDAQRSLNERDFEKNRESKSGAEFERQSPEQLNLQEKSKNKLREELLKAIKEGYKKDYEELIKRYFEVLEKQQNKK